MSRSRAITGLTSIITAPTQAANLISMPSHNVGKQTRDGFRFDSLVRPPTDSCTFLKCKKVSLWKIFWFSSPDVTAFQLWVSLQNQALSSLTTPEWPITYII